MPVIPLGLKAYRRDGSFAPEVECFNMYVEKDESGISPDNTLRIQRPGLSLETTLPGEVRGMIYAQKLGKRMTVAASSLYADEAYVGGIEGAGTVAMVANDFGVFIVGGGRISFYDGKTTVRIAMPDDRTVIDVEQINNYIILPCADGRFYWLVPGSTTVNALDFATAESSADGLISVVRVGDDLLMLGENSGEWWQSTGDPEQPFQRVSGRTYERGCLSRDSVKRCDNTVFWVGDDCNVYRGGAVPQIISNSGISERVRKAALPSAWVFGLDGHKFYVLLLRGQGTFAYDVAMGEWSRWASAGRDVWLPHVGYERAGAVYAASPETGAIWRVTPDVATDNGVAFERRLTATVPISDKPPRNDSFTIGTGSSGNFSVRLRWKDGQDDYPSYYDTLEARAPLDHATMYRLGRPDQPYRTFEVSCVDPVAVRFSGAMANEGWR